MSTFWRDSILSISTIIGYETFRHNSLARQKVKTRNDVFKKYVDECQDARACDEHEYTRAAHRLLKAYDSTFVSPRATWLERHLFGSRKQYWNEVHENVIKALFISGPDVMHGYTERVDNASTAWLGKELRANPDQMLWYAYVLIAFTKQFRVRSSKDNRPYFTALMRIMHSPEVFPHDGLLALKEVLDCNLAWQTTLARQWSDRIAVQHAEELRETLDRVCEE